MSPTAKVDMNINEIKQNFEIINVNVFNLEKWGFDTEEE